ncbi:MAG: LysR family transcriptional regulator [Ruminococcaceae bacterium]|nr:LysR family transcriptional regulator [Oscillospiraceae bacterium]
MKISQLEYILAVEQCGSINLAANKLFVSQSLISSAIIQLEEELGQPLFIRSNKGIALTSFGREFLPYARSVIDQIDQMKTLGQKKSSSRSLTVCNNSFRFAAQIAAQLYNRYEAKERISLSLMDCSRQECIDRVSNHMAELAVGRIWSFQQSILSRQLSSKDVRFHPLVVVPVAVAVGKNNPLYHYEGSSIPVSTLQQYTPIIFDHTMYNPISNIYDQLPELRIHNHITISSVDVCRSILDETNTYLLVSKFSSPAKMEDNWPGCRILDLADCSHTAQIGWFKHKHVELSPLAQEYVDLLSEYLQS